MINEIIAFTLLAFLVLATMVLCNSQDMELSSINDRLVSLEERAYTNIPKISIERGTVYAGSGEIVISEVKK